MIKATRFFFFDVDTSNCKAMISMIKATRFFVAHSAYPIFTAAVLMGVTSCNLGKVCQSFEET